MKKVKFSGIGISEYAILTIYHIGHFITSLNFQQLHTNTWTYFSLHYLFDAHLLEGGKIQGEEISEMASSSSNVHKFNIDEDARGQLRQMGTVGVYVMQTTKFSCGMWSVRSW